MSRFRAALCCAAVLLSSFSVAEAASLTASSPGYHYFYKQGATMEQHDEAVIDCAVRMRALANGGGAASGIGLAAGVAGGFAGGFLGAMIGGAIDSAENRQGAAANMENCMAYNGWSVLRLSESEGEAMETPEDSESVRAKLSPFVTAPTAPAPALRGPFANELATGNFTVDSAKDLDKVSMSVRAVSDRRDAALDAAGELEFPKPPKLPKGVKAPKRGKSMKGSALAAAAPARAYVVMRLVGDSADFRSTAVTVERLGADGIEIVYDGMMVAAEIGDAETAKQTSGSIKRTDHVIEVPPGLWKVAAISKRNFAVDLCFGAPSFVVAPGEVVFLGVMTIAETGGYPLGADIAVAKEILAANPPLAEKVKAAEWTNGFTSDCFGSYAYAYEIPTAPFVDMEALARTAPPGTDAPEAPSPADKGTSPAADASDTIASEPAEDE